LVLSSHTLIMHGHTNLNSIYSTFTANDKITRRQNLLLAVTYPRTEENLVRQYK